jgi:hypothetical protein
MLRNFYNRGIAAEIFTELMLRKKLVFTFYTYVNEESFAISLMLKKSFLQHGGCCKKKTTIVRHELPSNSGERQTAEQVA